MKNKKTERKTIPMILRQASFEPASFDEEKRTVDVVFSTGAQVRRFSFFEGEFLEELSLKKDEVRMERLNSGAPVLNNHRSQSLGDQIGVVEKASIKKGEGVATLRFSDREDVGPIVDDIRNGIIRNISVGYTVHKFRDMGENDDGVKVFRAVDWEPIEISAVPAGADSGAQFRSSDQQENECEFEFVRNEDPSEPQELETGSEPVEQPSTGEEMTEQEKKAAEEKRKAELKEARALAVKEEQKRQKDVRTIASQCKLGDEFVTEMVDGDYSADDVRKLALEKMHEAEAKTRSTVSTTQVVADERDTLRRGVENAILHRMDMGKNELSDEGRMYRGLSLTEIARECLKASGQNVRGLTPYEVAGKVCKRAGGHTSSDFPLILENISTKTLRDQYEAFPQTFEPLVRRVPLSDFKQVSRVQYGDAPSLDELGEKGEIQQGTIAEAAEKYALTTRAKALCMSRQMIVNDDLAAFQRNAELFARAARDLESDFVWENVINANPVMGDGNPLFDAAHSNLDSGGAGAPSDTLLGAVRAAMRKQVGLGGRLINIQPIYLMVPPELETVAEQLVSSISPTASSEVNPFSPSGRTPLQIIVEPRLSSSSGSATAWYMAGPKNQIDIIEMGTLDGAGPRIESEEGFLVEGVTFKVVYDLQTKAIDWRALNKNSG